MQILASHLHVSVWYCASKRLKQTSFHVFQIHASNSTEGTEMLRVCAWIKICWNVTLTMSSLTPYVSVHHWRKLKEKGEGRKGRESSASYLVARLLWACPGPHVSNPECVCFFVCTTKIWILSSPRFRVTLLCSSQCVSGSDGSWPRRAGLDLCGSDVRGFQLSQSGSEAMAGTQAVLVGLAVCLVDEYSVGCFMTVATWLSLTAMLSPCLMLNTCMPMLFKCWSLHVHNVLEIVVVYISLVELKSGQTLLLLSVWSLGTGNTWTLLEHSCDLPTQEVPSKNLHGDHVTRNLVPGMVWLCSTGVSDWNPDRKSWFIVGSACVSVMWVASELDMNHSVVLG